MKMDNKIQAKIFKLIFLYLEWHQQVKDTMTSEERDHERNGLCILIPLKGFYIFIHFTAIISLIFEQNSLHFNSVQVLRNYVPGAVDWLSQVLYIYMYI